MAAVGTGPTIGDVRSHGEFEGKSRLVEGAGETVLMTPSGHLGAMDWFTIEA
jgi:hypothetical protein